MKYPRNEKLLGFARHLRQSMTAEERKLWYECLRYCKPRFRRQEIIGNYIADFFCYEAAVVVELDGSQHYSPDGQSSDERRTAYFESLGIAVLRFSNTDIKDNFRGVGDQIQRILRLRGCDMSAIDRS